MKPTPSASARSSEPLRPGLRRRADCRLCGSRELDGVLSLGDTPLANEFVAADARGSAQDRFPLDVHLCRGCGHVQLLDVVDPERLFRDYVYVSSTSPLFVEHFRRYAEAMRAMLRPPKDAQVIEIGSNDGVLLHWFREAGLRVLGIDPARAIAEQATASGIPTLPEFFTPALAARLRREGWQPSLIAANNVFAHADDLQGIVRGVADLLAPDGLFVFEVSYWLDVVDKTLFDTIYHEHLSYHTVEPLQGFFERHGLRLIEAQRVDSHGGSLRGIAARANSRWATQPTVAAAVEAERARELRTAAAYRRFADDIQRVKTELVTLLRRMRTEGQRIAGFGAPAKATTLMFHFGIGPDLIDYIVDDSPWKQGRFSPGHHLPVVPSSWLQQAETKPDAVVVLAWNFAPSIIAKHRAFLDAGGRFIVPLPAVEVIG